VSAFALSGLPLVRACRLPLEARFVERPNRFIARVSLAGELLTAHLPDPGRLTGTLTPGCRVLLEGPHAPPRRCAYTLVAVRQGPTLVSTVPSFANRLFAELWRYGAFPEIPGGELAAEVVCGRSRFDFRAGDMLVEVKAVSLAEGSRGLFPVAVTQRGARHCRELARLAGRGAPAAVVFIAQRGDVASVEPAETIDPAFARALRSAAKRSVRVLAAAVAIAFSGAASARRIPVLL
jgi:sugar fermentation stimulation protein A